MAQNHVFLHPFPAQVDVAVFQADGFIGVFIFVDHERQGFGRVQDFDFGGFDFDFTGGHVRVFGSGRAGADDAADLQDPFGAGFLEGGQAGFGWVGHYLNQSVAIA